MILLLNTFIESLQHVRLGPSQGIQNQDKLLALMEHIVSCPLLLGGEIKGFK